MLVSTKWDISKAGMSATCCYFCKQKPEDVKICTIEETNVHVNNKLYLCRDHMISMSKLLFECLVVNGYK